MQRRRSSQVLTRATNSKSNIIIIIIIIMIMENKPSMQLQFWLRQFFVEQTLPENFNTNNNHNNNNNVFSSHTTRVYFVFFLQIIDFFPQTF
jgi:hypothetical protein